MNIVGVIRAENEAEVWRFGRARRAVAQNLYRATLPSWTQRPRGDEPGWTAVRAAPRSTRFDPAKDFAAELELPAAR